MKLKDTFTDNHGEEWRVVITLGKARRFDNVDKSEIGKDFSLLKLPDDFFEKMILESDVVFFIIWHMVKEDANKRGINSPDEFFDRLEGSHIHQATLAFYKALMDFFPERAISLLELALARDALNNKMGQAAESLTDDLERRIDQEISKGLQEAKTQLERQ
jgi:hypothetical protein